MADTFEKKERAEEAKYRLDQELMFKAESRRNKLLGLWLAEKFGLAGDKADSYAKDVVISDLEEPGDEDLMRKVMTDIAARGADVTEQQVRDKLEELMPIAIEQVEEEYQPDKAE